MTHLKAWHEPEVPVHAFEQLLSYIEFHFLKRLAQEIVGIVRIGCVHDEDAEDAEDEADPMPDPDDILCTNHLEVQ